MSIRIRKMVAEDWEGVARIYAEGIATGFATFEKQVPSYADWDQNHLSSCRLVAQEGEELLGWAALSPVSSRCVYGGVGEVSVYVGEQARGKGVGESLMKELIVQSEAEGLWTLQSGIFPENLGSIKLHEKVGFRKIGKRERIGNLDGVWKDNVLFERRSNTIGTT
ncbi:GNAT family N-acetyltransferase [Poritiphilus flavus]|uniref:GNAT family N-acetyltransferase n=1 Tax=Poritiphilus flavus TaxID=2697053 RepID=A0A6L9E879_9FLAO|nr:GNAT family N-acetyltransferase [Poritiphilus flavus]NAS10669.1 GNAT family N-acetyltransferase [Poritiphilus flavus]